MYTKHIDDMLEVPTVHVASTGEDIVMKQEFSDAV